MGDLLAEAHLEEPQRELVECIQISAHNLLTIANDILDFSKVEAGQMQLEEVPFDPSQLINETGRLFIHSAKHKSLSFTYSSNLPGGLELIGDPNRIRQIISNLLSNAIKFTSQGFVHLTMQLDGENVLVVVEDTGVGIDDEARAHLFQPFHQGDSSTARLYGGTGLGLVICQELAHLMGGEIDLQSKAKIGTKAIFTFPIVHAEVGQLQRARTLEDLQGERYKHCDRKVLIVEDNAINQKIALKSVKKLGYQASAVWNGKEALEFLLHHPEFHVVLMDVQMPVMDGYQATRILRSDQPYQHLKDIPVIALTASAIQGDREKCEDAGMNDYLSKPYPLTLLEEKLSKWAHWRT